MSVDARGAAPRRVVVETNVFELCELKTLAWRVYGVQSPGDASAAAPTGHLDDGSHDAAFARFADAVCSPPAAVTAWQASAEEQDDPLLWVFSINNSQPLPTEAAAASVRVVSEGTWSCESDEDESVSDSCDFKPRLFRALYAWLAKRLLAHGQFRVDGQFFCLAEAKFVYRRPSLSRVRHFDVFLDEAVAASGMAFHFELLPSHWLCVAVEMVHQDSAAASVSSEISGLATAWRRTLGIPHERDHAMIDVWHQDDLLAARVVAETKYDGIFPRFRAFPRRRKGGVGSGSDQGGGGHGDDSKADAHENEGDDDNHSANDADDDSATRGRNGGVLGKKKRRKPGANEAAENDESIIPVSPDPHVNSPDAGGPVVGMTFPRDRPLLFHTDHEIHVFKRRRRKKNEPSMGSLAKSASLSFGPLLVPPGAKLMPPLLRGRSTSQSSLSGALTKPETPKTPPPSLGASLAASLTHSDEREALDQGGRSKPLKIHPLLQALDDYVAEEMGAANQSKQETPMTSSTMAFVTLVPNAPGFSPSADEKKMKPINRSYDQQLQSQLLSDRFTRFLTGYYPRDLRRNKRQQRRERDRKILLDFDETKMLAYAGPPPAPETSMRDQEIAIGIHLAALDALVPWRLHGKANSRWTPYGSSSSSMRAADMRDTLTLVHHVTPHLTELQAIVKEKNGGGDSNNTSDDEGEVHDPWMTLERYCAETRGGADTTGDVMHATRIERVPLLCVATIESSVQVEIPAISEFTLRGFQPVAAPKPIDFAIVCPHSPSEWLGTLTLSYVAMFKSLYAQSAMGDQVALDLSSVASSANVHVDVANATMLVECATASSDAFATYRAAGEMLRPLLSQGIKKKQAFARSPVANVVYIVAPFGRSDIKHKLWLLGAFARGLFGEYEAEQGDWRKTVSLELLYLEDLITVGIDADPFALLPAAMALYDRIFERVALQPIAGSGADVTTRFVCERLYHLSDTKTTSESAEQPGIVHAGFSVSNDGKWLLTAFTDALGAVLETRAIAVADGDLSTALVSLVESALQFVALMGENARLAIAQLLPSSSTVAPVDADSWHALALDELKSRFALVVPSIVIYQASFLEKEVVQVRPTASTLVMVNERDGVLVIKPEDTTVLPERSRVANTKWLCSTQRASQETSVLRVQLVHTIPVSDSEAAISSSRDMLEDMLTQWTSLSYLTTHPISLQRQSPLPLHLAAVDELHSELELLEMQLSTDPLALRR